ncbi:MAG TPA: hypothetical protein VMQ65_05970 [Candidatus Limnocylindria bacterium]|nr:hypothetical protein [Candidatus Limnocylindria bacterium]
MIRVGLALVALILVGGCDTSVPFPNVSPKQTAGPVELVVAEATVDPSTCPSAPVEGTLIEDPETGLGLLERSGRQIHVIWPPGYTAGPSIGGTNLFRAPGMLLARSGEILRIGGLVAAGDGRLRACGEIEKVPFE